MTKEEAIAKVDEIMPNTISDEQKRDWLWNCELEVHERIVEKFLDPPKMPERDDSELTMPAPYCEGYVNYLQAHIALTVEEMDRYNIWITMFGKRFGDYETHMLQHHQLRYPQRNRFLF